MTLLRLFAYFVSAMILGVPEARATLELLLGETWSATVVDRGDLARDTARALPFQAASAITAARPASVTRECLDVRARCLAPAPHRPDGTLRAGAA